MVAEKDTLSYCIPTSHFAFPFLISQKSLISILQSHLVLYGDQHHSKKKMLVINSRANDMVSLRLAKIAAGREHVSLRECMQCMCSGTSMSLDHTKMSKIDGKLSLTQDYIVQKVSTVMFEKLLVYYVQHIFFNTSILGDHIEPFLVSIKSFLLICVDTSILLFVCSVYLYRVTIVLDKSP